MNECRMNCKYYDWSVGTCQGECQAEEKYQQGREDREEEIIDLIYAFEKTWNKESHKRVAHKAISKLIEFIMLNDILALATQIKEQKNG